MEKQKQYSLRDATADELEVFNNDLQAICVKHGVEMKTVPTFVPTTEGKYVVDSNVLLYKKVELIPKEEGVLNPFHKGENGGNSIETTEKQEEPKAD